MSNESSGSSESLQPSPSDAVWLSDAEQASWRAVLRGTRLLERSLDRALHAHDIQLSEYEILSMLSESGPNRLRMSDLAAMVVQSRSRLTHTAKRLEQRGWVTREACLDDRRGVELVLTPDGLREVQEMSRIHVQSVHESILDIMTAEQFQALGDAMALVRDHLDPEGTSGR